MESHLPGHPLSRGPAPAAREGPGARARAEARAGLYVHVPFCAVRCAYCDFSSGALSPGAVERWLEALDREAEWRAPRAASAEFSSVFFGGGTPSALPPRAFRRAWRSIARRFRVASGAEVTLEANPESVSAARLEAWAESGVNRLSMGAQSFHADELGRLGRAHGPGRPAAAFALARAHGFVNLSLDLMFGFPGHTLERWRATLERALELAPEHLSAYCFISEAGTPLGDAALCGAAALPEPAEQAEQYALLEDATARAGFVPYETSNFCRPGREARHNLVYWLRRPYVGLGPSAHGLWEGERWGNHYSLARWAEALEAGRAPEAERERETADSVADEVLMLGLRLAGGLRPGDHAPPVRGVLLERHGRGLERAVAAGRLETHEAGWRVPRAARFVADDVIAWVAARARATPAERPARRPAVDRPAVGSIIAPPCPSPPFPVA
jgi:oxygen-independent coproporphyrinogen-3 oxidase